MDSLNGHSAPQASRDGSGATSAESARDDALLQSTLDEIAELFRIKEAFPFTEESDEEEGNKDVPAARTGQGHSWWRRVADWCFGRSAGTRSRPVQDGDRQPAAATQDGP